MHDLLHAGDPNFPNAEYVPRRKILVCAVCVIIMLRYPDGETGGEKKEKMCQGRYNKYK